MTLSKLLLGLGEPFSESEHGEQTGRVDSQPGSGAALRPTLETDKALIHQALKRQREARTKRVKSQLP